MTKYAGNGRLNRRYLSWLFGKKTGRPDDECWKLERFVHDTLAGNGWRCRGFDDLMDFMRAFGVNYPNWPVWLAGSDKDADRWAVMEKQGDVHMWAWFEKSMRIGEWTAMNEDCAVTMRLVPFKNGFFKAEPL